MTRLAILFTTVCVAASGQLVSPNEAGVSMGHLHLNVSDVAAQKHFWVDLMGAKPYMLGTIEGVEIPGAIVLFKAQKPSAGTADSVVNHVGLKVKDLAQYNARLKAANIAFEANPNGVQSMAAGPDGVRLELSEDKALPTPVAFHHIHFYTVPVLETQAWYVKTFGAVPGKRGPFDAADLPGVNLTFSKADAALAPTKGRALDHIGFEIKNLEAFCRKLEGEGVHFDIPFRKVPALGISVAFFTDPWGTYIELTEGLGKQ